MGEYININRISAETHAQFDTFATGVMTDTMRKLTTPTQQYGMDDVCIRKLRRWVNAGLLNTHPGQAWSAMDVAMATVLTVLKKRGLSMDALRKIHASLNLPMYQDMSVLGFAVLLCQKEYSNGRPTHNAPYLLIDGENRITLCRAADMPLLLSEPEIPTYSHIVLNMGRVLHECRFIYKTQLLHEAEFSNLPAQIFDRLFDSATKRVTIDVQHGRLETVSHTGPNPEYGRRHITYADGHVVCEELIKTERIDV